MRPAPSSTLRILLVLALLAAAGLPAHARQIPIQISSCSVTGFGSLSPTGLTFDSTAGKFALTDSSADMVYLFDADCTMSSSFSTADMGSNSPQGIAHDPVAALYAIADNSADEVFFADADGLSLGQCDTAALGFTNPTGITFNSLAGNFAVTDSTADEVFLIDDSVKNGGTCALLGQFDTVAFGSTAPVDIAYLADTDEYAVSDNVAYEVFVVDGTGSLRTQFDTYYGFGASNPQAVSYLPTQQRYCFVDISTDTFYEIDARGTSDFLCSTAAALAFDPTGVAFNPNVNELVFVDRTTDAVYIMDAFTCALVRQFGTVPLGVDYASDIAYLPSTNQLILADSTDDELYFVGYDSGLLEAQCDTASLGILSPSGVDVIPQLDRLLVTDDSDDTLVLMDPSCVPLHQRSLGILEQTGAGTTPTGVAFHSGAGTFLVSDSSADDLFVMNFEGVRERLVDTAGLDLLTVSGVTALPTGDEFLVTDSTLDAVYKLKMPLLREALSLSGQFTSTGLSLGVTLFERGEGRFTGTIPYGGNDLPIFGYFDAVTGGIVFAGLTPAGAPVMYPGTVSPDLNTITLPAPLGTLVRTY